MDQIQNLMAFLDSAHSVYHAVAGLEKQLQAAGYRRLYEKDSWELIPGGKYYLIRGGTALIAFRLPEGSPRGFMMSASHSDRPTFKLKDHCEAAVGSAYTKLLVERYGGMLIAPWLDRPLSLAGRVMVETEDGVEARLVDIDRDLLLIPNVAIHLNRAVNEGYKWNPATDTLPLLGAKGAKLQPLLEEQAGGKILGQDLYLYIRQKACRWGMEEEFISSAALDDLECAWGCTQGFLNAKPSSAIPVLCVFDNEEVGSHSPEGAASDLLEGVLVRICEALELDIFQLLANSFMVSADNAHGMHPNHPELSDSANAPTLGGGVVLKFNATQSYCTDGISAAIFRKICAGAEVPLQVFWNRADLRGGGTLGNISLGHVSVPTADIGLPQLAMHSCYETAAAADAEALVSAMTAYYSAALEATETGFRLI